MPTTVDSSAAQLLASDVVTLEQQLDRSQQELRIARELLSEALHIAYQALAHIVKIQGVQ